MVEAPDETRRLVGEELAAVIFIRDYVQLQFEGFVGQMFNAYNPVTVEVGGTWLAPGARGWRDAVCARIGQVVRDARTIVQQEIRIEFADGAAFSVSLLPNAFEGPEAAVLQDIPPRGTRGAVVWQ